MKYYVPVCVCMQATWVKVPVDKMVTMAQLAFDRCNFHPEDFYRSMLSMHTSFDVTHPPMYIPVMVCADWTGNQRSQFKKSEPKWQNHQRWLKEQRESIAEEKTGPRAGVNPRVGKARMIAAAKDKALKRKLTLTGHKSNKASKKSDRGKSKAEVIPEASSDDSDVRGGEGDEGRIFVVINL
jgi:hypothetical protein